MDRGGGGGSGHVPGNPTPLRSATVTCSTTVCFQKKTILLWWSKYCDGLWHCVTFHNLTLKMDDLILMSCVTAGTAASAARSVGPMNGKNTGRRTPRSSSPDSVTRATTNGGQKTPRYACNVDAFVFGHQFKHYLRVRLPWGLTMSVADIAKYSTYFTAMSAEKISHR